MDNFASKKPTRYAEPEVSLDYFLYSCFEAEKLKKGQPVKHSAVIETLLHDEQTLGLDEFYDGLLDTVSFYKAQYPDFGTDGPITMTTLNDIVPPFVDLHRDIRVLVESFTKTNEVNFLRDQLSLSPMWQSVERVISSSFPRNHDIFLKFLFWSFAEKGPDEDEVGQRPPIGRFSPFASRAPRFGDRSGPSGGKRRDGGSRFGGDRDRGPRGGDRDRGPRNDRGDRGDRQPRADFEGNRGDRPRRDRGEGRRDRGPKEGPRAPRDRDPRVEEESIAVVVKAARELRDNPGMLEFKLPPANSYYRLLQHQQVKKEGFFSRSEGEGQERALVITRTGDLDNEGNA